MSQIHERMADLISLLKKAPRQQQELHYLTGLQRPTVKSFLLALETEGLVSSQPVKVEKARPILLWTWQE
jgi:DNA-binding IclR family transcriptional regulator